MNQLAPELSEKLGCKEVHFIITENASDDTTQVELLLQIAKKLDGLKKGDTISLDITNSLRHIPVLALLMIRFLKNKVKVDKYNKDNNFHIYYGARDLTENGKTPIIDLIGLLDMLDWVDALSAYKQSDNYEAFIPLLDENYKKLLQDAAFYENTNQLPKAQNSLAKFRKALEKNEIDNPFIDLVKDDLDRRMEWESGSNYDEHQLNLAKRNLESGHYWQASILATEAWISKLVLVESPNANVYDYHICEDKKIFFQKNSCGDDKKYFDDLTMIRNAVAHGTDAKNKITGILSNKNKLHGKLEEILNYIEGWPYY